jgi:hypothetical protein
MEMKILIDIQRQQNGKRKPLSRRENPVYMMSNDQQIVLLMLHLGAVTWQDATGRISKG